MRRSVFAVIAGLVLAFALAAFLALILRLPLADWRISEHPLLYVARALFPIAAFALPFALAAIGLSETRRVRGLSYWLFVGALIGILGYIAVVGGSPATRPAYQTMRTFFALAAMGLAGGFVYWWVAGRHAGRVAAALADAGSGRYEDDVSRRRCWWCGVSGLALSLVPLALLGWYAIYRPAPKLADAIIARSEAEAASLLGKAGVPRLTLKITDHIGRVTGIATSDFDRTKSFDIAKGVLAPMVGLPGVVNYLQNDIVVAEAAAPAAPPPGPTDGEEAARRQSEAEAAAKRAAQKVAEAEAATRAADEAGQAALDAAKRKSEEIIKAAEKAAAEKAEAERKAAEEAAARRKAEEEARLAAEKAAAEKAEADRKAAEEAEARRKAEAEARLAAEKAEAERVARAKAEAERLAREAEARKASEETEARAAAELAASEKALEEARRIAEAEAERKAVEAAHAAEAEAKARAKSEADARAASADGGCAAEFSDLFKSETIRFRFRSAVLSESAEAYLDRVAALAKRCGGYDISAGGHSDRSGKEGYNTRISMARAEAVRQALIARAIAPERLTSDGYGSQRPFDLGNSRTANALNRRVDLGYAPASSRKAKAAEPEPSPAARSAIAPAECNSEFSRLFLSETIRFNGASVRIAPAYAPFLDKLAALMAACPDYKLSIGGHTDRRGSEAANQRLSEARAKVVAAALTGRGVASSRISSSGYAGARPFDPGSSREAFALNRRVDFGVSGPQR